MNEQLKLLIHALIIFSVFYFGFKLLGGVL